MKAEKIKPIPKYILRMIEKKDRASHPQQDGCLRFYSYLTKNDGELVKVTVAVKCRYRKWYAKQVAVHGVHSDKCFLKDMVFHYLSGYSVGWYAEGHYKQPKWYEDEEWGWQVDGMFDPYAPIVNKDYLSKFPEYKYAAWELYKQPDIFKYLRLYEQFPQLEYLMKTGMRSNYAMSKQLLKKAGKDKQFRKWLYANREKLSKGYYYISTILTAYKQKSDLDTVQQYENMKKAFTCDRDYKPIRQMLNKDYKPYFAYLEKQKISHRLYLDYLNACNYLGLDMSEDKNRYPHDFHKWHDIRIDERKALQAQRDREKQAELYQQFAAIAEKYLLMQYDKKSAFVVFIARSPEDLRIEGEALHHCVGRLGYDQKFIREESLIFFIRSKEKPEVPLATVEYSPSRKKILQCYADHNTKPDDTVMDYVNKIWLPYANRTLKKIAA